MQINHCLILAAGFGTRMGTIGKSLPKVLWPVFEKSLLELQVGYAKSLGIQNIFINLHHAGEEIHNFCKERSAFEDVTFLWEKPEILDIGGAIQHLASLPDIQYEGRLLVLNADQFFYMSQNEILQYLQAYAASPAILFSYPVNSSLGYNALKLDSERVLKAIVKNPDLPRDKAIETYTGISIIDLAKLTKTAGKSAFFDSVCPYQSQEIPAVLLEKIDYWDFGTLRRYWETSFRILSTYREHATHPFLRFLVDQRALKTWKIDLQKLSYHASSREVINLVPEKLNRDLNASIILKGQAAKKVNIPGIWWDEYCEEVKL
jgi:NDP-sugar pyrophosphorylase family protein